MLRINLRKHPSQFSISENFLDSLDFNYSDKNVELFNILIQGERKTKIWSWIAINLNFSSDIHYKMVITYLLVNGSLHV